jgi:phosphoribosyl-ATP pyrophosphohydrolase / phosphoribosyl-AMP cyclohydrolase / histidinol dehydrogenase
METMLPLPFIPHVDLAGGPPFQKGITRDQLSYLGCVYFTAGDSKVERLLGFLKHHVSMRGYISATAFTSQDTIMSILDAGARTVFVESSQLAGLESYGDRIALVTSHSDAKHDKIPAGGVLITCGDDISSVKSALQAYTESKTSPIFLYSNSVDKLQTYVDLAREHSAIAIIPAPRLTMENENVDDQLSVPAIIGAAWTSDRNDRLIPTIVSDERDVCLGLVYSSQESLSESLKTGKGIVILL